MKGRKNTTVLEFANTGLWNEEILQEMWNTGLWNEEILQEFEITLEMKKNLGILKNGRTVDNIRIWRTWKGRQKYHTKNWKICIKLE